MANVLPFARRVDIAAHLVDGCSINATSRLLKVHKQTVLDLLVLLGESCARMHDRLVLGDRPRAIVHSASAPRASRAV